ncbi:MAG: hypothetical protein PHT69_06915 [Bacteroidales bacterium]|nr:hypothetical protein [Bacteroidales bacterium]
MLFNLFNKNTLKSPVDVSFLKSDMHSHLIPGIDDGVKTIEESVSLIRKLQELGYTKVITTPHIMSDFYKNTPEIITDGLNKLKEVLSKENISIQIEAAAEYLIDDGFINHFNKNQLLTFGDKYLLVEMSYYNMYKNFFQLLFELNVDGYKVILAHPERYAYLHNNMETYQEIKSRGLYFQLNTISLSGYYSEKVKKVAESLIDMELYDFAGTDLHNDVYFMNFKKALYSKHFLKLAESGKLKNHLL